MRISCTIAWDEMIPMGQHRFCTDCSKPVFDLTGIDRHTLERWYAGHPDACAMFDTDQIDPGTPALDRLGRSILLGLAASLATLAIGSAEAQTSRSSANTSPVEQTMPADTLSGATYTGLQGVVAGLAPISMPVLPDPATPETKARRWVVSKRFPFVRRARNYRVIGCPSF